jgi:hypothetical protein
LLKVTRRRRRRSNQAGEDDVHSEGGIYKIELPGTIKQTVRYRGALVQVKTYLRPSLT